MKLIKVENEHEIWYFSTQSKAAHWINTHPANLAYALGDKSRRCKGYQCEWIESGDILSRFIDPEYGTHAQ